MWLYIRLCNECFMFEHKDVYMFIVIFIHKCNPSQIKKKTVNDYRRVKLIKSFQMPKCVNFQIKWKKKPWNVNHFSRTAHVWLWTDYHILPMRSKNGNDLLVPYPLSTDAAQSVLFLGTKQWVLKNIISLKFSACVLCCAINSNPLLFMPAHF